MKNTILTTALVAALALVPAPALAMDKLGMSPQETAAALNQVDEAMSDNLDGVINQLETLNGPIVFLPYICPHLIDVLGRIGVGEITPDAAGENVVLAIMDDQKMAAEMLFSTGKVPTMAENGMSLQIKLANRSTAATMIDAAKFAQDFLAR